VKGDQQPCVPDRLHRHALCSQIRGCSVPTKVVSETGGIAVSTADDRLKDAGAVLSQIVEHLYEMVRMLEDVPWDGGRGEVSYSSPLV
jgi:hypothetical protein